MKLITANVLFAAVLFVSSPALVFSNETTTCDDPFISPENGICEPSCYCIPDDASAGCDVCPATGDRQFAADMSEEAAFFAELEVDETSLFKFDPPGCQPYPAVAAAFGQTLCDGVVTVYNTKAGKAGKKKKKNKGGAVQCSFEYKKDICESKKYRLLEEPMPKFGKKKKGKKAKSISGISATHEGSCGVCSSAQDLAANLSPTLSLDASTCTTAAAPLLVMGEFDKAMPSLLECFGTLGFSSECSFMWSSNSLNTLWNLGEAIAALVPESGAVYTGPASCTMCAATCLLNPDQEICTQPLTPGTCELSPCFLCDEEVSGPVFKAFGARTRRNSGIINTQVMNPGQDPVFVGSKRRCSTIANLQQPARICPVTEEV